MTAALTRFGTFCRDKRTANNFTMGDQSDALGIDVPSISAIECGTATMPSGYLESLGSWLKLSESERNELKKRGENNVIALPHHKHISKNSSSIRFFRKLSRMNPKQIRTIRQGKGKSKDDG